MTSPPRRFSWFWAWLCLGLAASVPALVLNGLAGDMVLFGVTSAAPALALPAGALGELAVCCAVFLGAGLLVEIIRKVFGIPPSLHPGIQLAAVLILEIFIVYNCAAVGMRQHGLARNYGLPEMKDAFAIRLLVSVSILTGLLWAWRLRRAPASELAGAVRDVAFFLCFLVGGFAVVYQRWIRADSYPLPGIVLPLLLWGGICALLCWPLRKPSFSPARISLWLLGACGLSIVAQTAYYAWPVSGDLPNIVVDVWDAARADRLSVYGGQPGTTPHLRKLAEDGIVFDNAFSVTNYTYPSHVTYLTGKDYREHGYHIGDGKDWKRYKKERTLPEYLRGKGYYSVLVTENTWVLAADKGFDQVRWFARPTTYFGPQPHQCEFSVTTEYWNYRLPYLGRWLVNRLGSFLDRYYPETLDEIQYRYFQKVLIQSRRAGPLFLFINWMNVHDRLHPFSDWKPEEEVFNYDFPAEYDLSLRQIDLRLAELVSLLRTSPRGYYLIVTSDHGELLGEYGLYGHNMTLFEEVLHVPLIVTGRELGRSRWHPLVSMNGLFRLVGLLA
ncbi:MAG TPA: sulfatase-like hydrolase/transferase, partial [bacterium]|nr:sulfatase-like hydrolase/transferase [bacterium]